MTVKELIEKLKQMPQDAMALNGHGTELGTLVIIMNIGTKKVIPYRRARGSSCELKSGAEFRVPVNDKDESETVRERVVVIT